MRRVVLLTRSRFCNAAFALGLCVSLAAHILAVTSFFRARSGELGSVDLATTAISVNLETTDIVDAIDNVASKEASSSPVGMPIQGAQETRQQPDDAKDDEALPPAKTAIDKPQAEEQSRLAEQSDAERRRAEDLGAAEKSAKEEAVREETKRRAEEKEKAQRLAEAEEAEKRKRERERQAAVAGGAGTSGSLEAEQSQGHVSASKGSVLNYGASLRALISSNTPRNIRKTSLRLAFSVDPSGGLNSVAVIRPSSDPAIDKRIIEVVTQHPR